MASLPIDQQPDLKTVIRAYFPGAAYRLHWIAITCVGLRPDDVVQVCPSLPRLAAALTQLGHRCTGEDPTVIYLNRPREGDIRSRVAKLQVGSRLVIFNDEIDIEKMDGRAFEKVTACIFDQQSRRTIRVFDSLCFDGKTTKDRTEGKRVRVGSYINVELADITDSSLSMHASQIAALR